MRDETQIRQDRRYAVQQSGRGRYPPSPAKGRTDSQSLVTPNFLMLAFVKFVRDIVSQRLLFEGSFFHVIGERGRALRDGRRMQGFRRRNEDDSGHSGVVGKGGIAPPLPRATARHLTLNCARVRITLPRKRASPRSSTAIRDFFS